MVDKPNPEAEPKKGGVTIADNVIAKIAYTACREIDGVHALGGRPRAPCPASPPACAAERAARRE